MTFTPIVLGSGVAAYRLLAKTRDDQQALMAASPQISRDTQAFKDRIKDVQSAEDLMADRDLLRVALGAFGLDEDIGNTAFIEKILTSDLEDPASLANRLADTRYKNFAKAFNFGGDSARLPDKTADDVSAQLADIRTADDLLDDPFLLRATLKTFGLEGDRNNIYFLREVLNSDLDDPASFVNGLRDPAYVELAEAFDLQSKTEARDSIYGFVDTFAEVAGEITEWNDLRFEPELLGAALGIFGLETDADRPEFIKEVLESDLSDPGSVANLQEDRRYAALADAFGFVDRAVAEAEAEIARLNAEAALALDPDADVPDPLPPYESKLEKLIEAVSARDTPVATAKALYEDQSLTQVMFDFFDLPARSDQVDFTNRIFASDRASPTSLVNVFPDKRYEALADAFVFLDENAARTYPAGFAEQVTENYLDRQFEIRLGDSDPAMRIAVSLERELEDVVATGSSNDTHWFSLMASPPLREVFETVFQLSSSFGNLDIDRQLSEFKDRADSVLGTDQVADFLDPDRLEEIRQRFLVLDSVGDFATGSQPGVTSALLASLQN